MATAPAANDQADPLNPEVPADLVNFLVTESQGARDTLLDDQRAASIRAYQGDPYGDEQEGRSQAVTRDVSEVTDFMLAGIIGTIMAGGKAVEFETEPEQVQVTGPDGQPMVDPQTQQPQMQEVDYGAQATKAVQYQFFRKQKGYRILHDAVKAAMIEKTGIIRTYAEPVKPVTMHILAPPAMIEGDEESPMLQGMAVTGVEPADDPDHDDATQTAIASGVEPPSMAMRLHTITVQQPQPPIIRDEAIPNEWFLVSPDTVELDDSPYVGQCTPTTVSALVAMGFDPERVKDVWQNAPSDTVVEYARDSERSRDRKSVGQRKGSERQLWLYTEYPLWDLNGDGITERLCVMRIGREVLSVTEVDEQPYSGGSPVPMQFRFTGQSVADKVMDIQRIRSVLMRQALDSLYISNAPRMLIHEDSISENTIDDLLTVRPGALGRWKGSFPPTPLAMQDTSAVAFQAMEMMHTEREGRTGITRQSQGLNPDVTKNDTATAFMGMQANADQIELYVTRNLVESLVAPMFAKRYRLMKAHAQPFRMKIDGKWQEIDPRQWPDEPDVAINVGLGTGTKDQRIAYRDKLIGYAADAVQGGMRFIGEDQLHNMFIDQAEDMGFSYPSRYAADPASLPPAPPQPDPATAKVQADAQTQQAKDAQAHQQAMTRLQLQDQEQQANAALKAQANDQDLAAKREKSALDIELARQKAQAEAALAERQQVFEMSLAERRFAFDQDMARKKHEQAAQSDDSLTKYRDGGSLSE